MSQAIRDPIPPAWVSRPLCLSGRDETPLLRGWIHFGAAVLAVPAGAALAGEAAGSAATPYVVVYAVAMVLLYAVSASYHLLPVSERARYWLRRADHATIYVFIGAAYTPYCGLVVRGRLGDVVLGLVWAGAAFGVAGKLTGFDRFRPLTGGLYMALGWLALVTLPEAVARLGLSDLFLLAAMGLAYTGGAVVLALRRPDPVPDTFGYHELWHSLVVVAGICYFVVVWGLVAAAR